METEGITCVGVVEVAMRSAGDDGKEWNIRLGFGVRDYSETLAIGLQKRVLELVKAEVAGNHEKYGFGADDVIEYRTGVKLLPCEQLIGT